MAAVDIQKDVDKFKIMAAFRSVIAMNTLNNCNTARHTLFNTPV